MLVQFQGLSAVTSFVFLLHFVLSYHDSKIPKYPDRYIYTEISTEWENALERREKEKTSYF